MTTIFLDTKIARYARTIGPLALRASGATGRRPALRFSRCRVELQRYTQCARTCGGFHHICLRDEAPGCSRGLRSLMTPESNADLWSVLGR